MMKQMLKGQRFSKKVIKIINSWHQFESLDCSIKSLKGDGRDLNTRVILGENRV